MEYEILADILVANNFGRMNKGSFHGKNVSVFRELDDTFLILARGTGTLAALEKLFSNEPSIKVKTMGEPVENVSF